METLSKELNLKQILNPGGKFREENASQFWYNNYFTRNREKYHQMIMSVDVGILKSSNQQVLLLTEDFVVPE